MKPLEYYLEKLFLLKSLKPGETISTTSFTIVDKNNWSTSIWRLVTRENRDETVEFIKQFIESAIIDFPTKDIIFAVRGAILGLETLKITYINDGNIRDKISKLIWNISYLNNNIIIPVDSFKSTFSEAILTKKKVEPYSSDEDEEPVEIINEIIIFQPKIKSFEDLYNNKDIFASYYKNFHLNNIWAKQY